jgi:hypothetical protein
MTAFYSNGIRLFVDYCAKCITEEQEGCAEYDMTNHCVIILLKAKKKIGFNILFAFFVH